MRNSGRLAASIEILDLAADGGPPADRVLDQYLRARRYIGSSDRRAISERVWGIFRRRARLDWWLKRAPKGLRTDGRGRVLADLALTDRLKVQQISELFDGSHHGPASVTKEENVALRELVGKPFDHNEMPDHVGAECPDWLWSRMEAQFGAETGELVRSLNDQPPFDLRLNELQGVTRESAIADLQALEIEAVPGELSPICIRLDKRRPIDQLELFKQGALEVQDEGSQLAALLVGAKPGMTVFDYCAGAGGKSLVLASGMRNKGRLLLMDVSQGRLDRAAVRLRRAGIHNAERRTIVPGDKTLKRLKGKADRVLVDAPCSGTGTWRRNPDSKWRYSEEDLANVSKEQSEIVERAARLVAPGGRLIYVTCSLLRDENEAAVEKFLAAHSDFQTMEIAPLWEEAVTSSGGGACPALTDPRYLRLDPLHQGTDGFFVAVLQRAKPAADSTNPSSQS